MFDICFFFSSFLKLLFFAIINYHFLFVCFGNNAAFHKWTAFYFFFDALFSFSK